MDFKIFINQQEVKLQPNETYFKGYINQAKTLLYDAQALAAISSEIDVQGLDKVLETINGAFQLLMHKDNKLYFTIDHFGGYSLFYKLNSDSIEIYDNPMLSAHDVTLNDTALCSIMATGFALGEDTIYCEIKECLPGTLYSYDLSSGKLETKTWFNYISTDEVSLNTDELMSIIADLFPATEKGDYTSSLSGGIDSRFLLACLLKKEKPFQAFSFGSDLNQDKHIASAMALKYHVNHQRHNFNPDTCKEQYTDTDIDFIIHNCTFGRSLPNETDLISSKTLNPDEHIICKGFGGDWLTGRYMTPQLLKCHTPAQMTKYLFDKYFNLTCMSSGSYKHTLFHRFEALMNSTYYSQHKNLISAEEQWNQHHNERKYIINTLAYYKASSFRFYLPFYDRNLLGFFAKLRYTEKIDQNGYFKFLRESFFTNNLSQLKESTQLRPNFVAPLKPTVAKEALSAMHNLLRKLDTKKLRKRYARLPLAEFADSLMLFTHEIKAKPFLTNKIVQNFPHTMEVSDLLKKGDCPEASLHIAWLSKQTTSQLNINGLSLCKFFFNKEFIQALNKHIS
jgi:asparagine synthetase B (glutamine-hydrolysing)